MSQALPERQFWGVFGIVGDGDGFYDSFEAAQAKAHAYAQSKPGVVVVVMAAVESVIKGETRTVSYDGIKQPANSAKDRLAGLPMSLREAAHAIGKSKSTISRAISSGRLVAKQKGNGNFSISLADLLRAFPPVSEEGLL